MTTYDPSSTRLQLLHNGYYPTPNLDKRCILKGWNSPAFVDALSPETIAAWKTQYRGFKATGMLVRDGLMPIDLDISDETMVDEVTGALYDIAPEGWDRAPWRTGKYPKLMMFYRWQASTTYPDMFTRIASNKFVDETGQGHQIEIFGGALTKNGHASKQVGAFGPHSYEEDTAGNIIKPWKVKRSYEWGDEEGGPTPLSVPLAQLPMMTQDQAWKLLAAFEELAKARGWTQQTAPAKTGGQFIYDITEATRFNVQNGPQDIDYTELCAQDIPCRVDGSFIDGSTHRRDKCLVDYCNARQAVGVWDTEGAAWHLPKEAAPRSTEDHNAAFQEALTKLQTSRLPPNQRSAPPAPQSTDGLAAQAYWLLQTHAFCAPNNTMVRLFEPSDVCELRPAAFQTRYLAWREDSEGPRGGKHVALATAAWLIHPDRPNVEGVRMRPDMDYPLYEEGGHFFKNTYLKPTHAGDGEAETFLTFIEHLLPIATEQAWFLDWLAHKHRYPDIPGVAIVMVAASEQGPIYGAGRGMLRDVLARLMGERYVRAIDFDVFSGRSAQGVYTDWAAYATLVTVSESKDTPESGRWSAQRAVYERIKEIVDPRPTRRTFMRKGLPAFEATCFASYLIFSNNRDALQIPANDRRVTALQNGLELTPERAIALQAWMEMPGNIAALARLLEARDLTAFNAYTPLRTATKTVMQELARSELDEAYDFVRRRIGPSRLFTGEQVRQAVLAEIGDVMGSEMLRQQITRKLRGDATAVEAYRLSPTHGRHKILAWRGSVTGDLTVEQAQASVQRTAAVLFDTSSVTVPWPVTPHGDSDKE
jgi:hypothetical protein